MDTGLLHTVYDWHDRISYQSIPSRNRKYALSKELSDLGLGTNYKHEQKDRS